MGRIKSQEKGDEDGGGGAGGEGSFGDARCIVTLCTYYSLQQKSGGKSGNLAANYLLRSAARLYTCTVYSATIGCAVECGYFKL